MTISLNLANIANSIASISISGVTVKDKDEMAGTWVSLPNVLYPKPDGWITNLKLDYVSFLKGANAKINVSYTLTYRFLGVQIGDLAIFPQAYSDLIDKVILIVNAIITNDAPSGSIDIELANIDIAPKADPAGNNFFGADISINVLEFQN